LIECKKTLHIDIYPQILDATVAGFSFNSDLLGRLYRFIEST
jgi:hypothetical protein